MAPNVEVVEIVTTARIVFTPVVLVGEVGIGIDVPVISQEVLQQRATDIATFLGITGQVTVSLNETATAPDVGTGRRRARRQLQFSQSDTSGCNVDNSQYSIDIALTSASRTLVQEFTRLMQSTNALATTIPGAGDDTAGTARDLARCAPAAFSEEVVIRTLPSPPPPPYISYAALSNISLGLSAAAILLLGSCLTWGARCCAPRRRRDKEDFQLEATARLLDL
jgi:hypothetical protein